MRVRGFCCGWLDTDLSLFVRGASGALRVPVPAHVIEHAGRTVVFDAGLNPLLRTEAETRLGVLAPRYTVDLPPGAALDEQLAALDIDPAGVDAVVASHLHYDHAGGMGLLPEARLIVQRDEWDSAQVSDDLGYLRADFDCGHNRELVDGEHDLFGDGRAVLIPTPGHTAGHQSLRLRLDDGGEIVLCADACYLRRSLEEQALPPFGHDRERQRASMRTLAELEAGGAHLVFGHDPEQWPTGM